MLDCLLPAQTFLNTALFLLQHPKNTFIYEFLTLGNREFVYLRLVRFAYKTIIQVYVHA